MADILITIQESEEGWRDFDGTIVSGQYTVTSYIGYSRDILPIYKSMRKAYNKGKTGFSSMGEYDSSGDYPGKIIDLVIFKYEDSSRRSLEFWIDDAKTAVERLVNPELRLVNVIKDKDVLCLFRIK